MKSKGKNNPEKQEQEALGKHSPAEQILEQVVLFSETGRYEKCLALLKKNQHTPELRNALGVCLLRLGRTEEAVRILRSLVLKPNCTWAMPEAPVLFKLNFATALLLAGLPSGCLSVLAEIRSETLPQVVRLRGAIRKWERTLSWWNWLNWKIGLIDPANSPVLLGFLPGEFVASATEKEPHRPDLRPAA